MSVASRLPCDESLAWGQSPADATRPGARRWVLAASILGSSLAFIDGTVVNIALPAIQRDLGASLYLAQWVFESYALLLASLLLLGGALSDRYGRRRVFLVGVAIFGLASIGCGLSQTMGQLIAARGVQGVGAALLVPGSMALISAHFAEAERGRAFGLWTAFSGITSAAGPLLGGYLVDRLSWGWAFAVNVPIALLVLAITWWRVPETPSQAPVAPLDWGGAACTIVALGGAAFAFTQASTAGWGAAEVVIALALALLAAVAFFAVERRHPAPMLPMRLLRNRVFAGANILTLLLYAALGGGLFFLPLNLVQVQGWSATAAGASLLPFVLLMFLLSRWAGGLVARYGARLPLTVGPLVAAAGFALLMMPGTGAVYWTGFLPGVLVLGLGMTVTVAPLTTTVMNAVATASVGVASGVNNAVSRVAGLLAIAILGWVLGGVFEAVLQQRLQGAGLPPDVVAAVWSRREMLAALRPPVGAGEAAAAAIQLAVKESFVAGFRAVMGISALLALAAAVTGFSSIGGKRPEQRPGRSPAA